MDESWRMSIGGGFAHNNSARRRSVVNRPDVPADDEDDGADADDFQDVFGGPPRILRHRRSAAAGFYKEVFSPPAEAAVGITGRRNLPGFRIPPAPNIRRSSSLGVATEDDFYDDIFTADAAVTARDRRSRSRSTTKSSTGNNCKSRSNSSSSDHDSSASYLINSHPRTKPTIVHHDATLSSFASKLRPITIPTRQEDSSQPSTISGGGGGGGSSNRTVPISNIQFSSFADNKAAGSTTMDFSYSTLSPSAETSSSYYCPNCCRKQMTWTNSMYHFSGAAGSPSSSVTFSAALEPILSTAPIELRELEKKVVLEVKKERERSFVDRHFVRETEGAAALDEAIAWARGKFWNQQASDMITSDEILEYSEEPKGSKEKRSPS